MRDEEDGKKQKKNNDDRISLNKKIPSEMRTHAVIITFTGDQVY